jgi:hypothetical protein
MSIINQFELTYTDFCALTEFDTDKFGDRHFICYLGTRVTHRILSQKFIQYPLISEYIFKGLKKKTRNNRVSSSL